MATRFLGWLPLLAAAALSSGCGLLGGDDGEEAWVSTELRDGPPRRDLLKACEWAVLQAEFPVYDRDDVSGRVTSGWDVNLAPYSFQGTRSRAVIEVEELGGNQDYRLRVRVEVERNQEVHQTLELAAADWEPDGYDQTRARVVLQQILVQVRRPASASGRAGSGG